MLGPEERLAHYFLRCVFQLAGDTRGCAGARERKTEPIAGQCAERSAPANAGSSGELGAQTKSDRADRSIDGGGERSGSKRGARSAAATSEPECDRYRRAAQPAGVYRQEFPGIFSTRRSFPNFLGGTGIQRVDFRFNPVPAVSRGA